ncbi:cytochrome c [Limoniibacter endophyticus]|uniref:Cytochrome c n=1 Tax=Limoniibacter endophyticus TaxID=1565040 RepID=A0A8J3GIS6_9HYPH|nr:cytochrome c [Limoniibacter endophyticus]GHC80572.1 cytochrome c [Limoniibacter endophyticus]
MKKIFKVLFGLVILGLVALAAFIFVPVQKTPATKQLAADFKPAEGAGEYVMRAGDCMACHTAEGGKPFAGGRAIASPMGTIWTTNITPDKETGIGDYTLDDFRASLYDGIRKDGAHLYPAMPYENYRKMTEEDVVALYDYFMNQVEPVSNKVEETTLSFPFNMRFGLRAWNWLALNGDAGFTPVEGQSEVYNRGAYLVQGAGHCAACHSPRNLFMGQDGIDESSDKFLTGGDIDGYTAPDLRGPDSASQSWTSEQMALYLSTARNAHTSATGEMMLVIRDSLQYMTPDDNMAIATYLKTISGGEGNAPVQQPAQVQPTETEKMLTEAKADLPIGPRLYLDNCAACHFVTGKGAAEIFPELAGNSLVTAASPKGLVSVILHGAELPSTEQRPMKLRMQGYAERLSDEEVAELATFLRTAWGNEAPAVTPADVAGAREAVH